MNKLVFKLFVLGQTSASGRVLNNLEKLCNEKLSTDQYEITVIDILKKPELSEEYKIIAIPTLIKESPLPALRIIGDLTDIDAATFDLNIDFEMT